MALSFLSGSFYGLIINNGYIFKNIRISEKFAGFIRYDFIPVVFLFFFASIFIDKIYMRAHRKNLMFANILLIVIVLSISFYNTELGTGSYTKNIGHSLSYYPEDFSYWRYSFSKNSIEYLEEISTKFSNEDKIVTSSGERYIYFFIHGRAPVYNLPRFKGSDPNDPNDPNHRDYMKRSIRKIKRYNFFVAIDGVNVGKSQMTFETLEKYNLTDMFIPVEETNISSSKKPGNMKFYRIKSEGFYSS